MTAPPFLKLGRAAIPAALVMLVGSKPNPNSGFLRAMATTSGEALASHLSSTSGFPSLLRPKPPRALQLAETRRVLYPVGSCSSSSEAAFAAEQGSAPPLVVVSFYRFADFPDHAELRKPLKDLCEELDKI